MKNLRLLLLLFLLNNCGTDVKWLLQKDTEWSYQEHSQAEFDTRDAACNWIYVGISDSKTYWETLAQDIKKWLAALVPYQPLQDCENIVTK